MNIVDRLNRWNVVKTLILEGKTRKEIQKETNLCISQIERIAKKFNLTITPEIQSSVQSKIDIVKPLIYQGFVDSQISKITGIPKTTVCRIRKEELNISSFRTLINLTDAQKSILVGIILGDGYLSKKSTRQTSSLTIAHSIKQKDFFLWKFFQFPELFKHYKISDKYRLNKKNTEIRSNSITCNILGYYRDLFYVNNIKTITPETVQLIDELALAVLFMDDGGKADTTYNLCTNGFCEEACCLLQKHLLDKWGIQTTLNKKRVIRIKCNSKNIFTSIIKPYIIPSMEYKLHPIVLTKSDKLLGSLGKDNQQPIVNLNG